MIRRMSSYLLTTVAIVSVSTLGAQAQSALTHHVRDAVRSGEAKSVGRLPATQIMSLDIVLPLRNQAGLDMLVSEINDPNSAQYRQFLTVPEFTAAFGPTEADYDAVVQFAKMNGFTVTGDAFSMDLKLNRFMVAGHVTLHDATGTVKGAAIADFLDFRRIYFVPVTGEPDRWTFLDGAS